MPEINQELLDGLNRAANSLRFVIDNHECGCKFQHLCGRDEVIEDHIQIREIITKVNEEKSEAIVELERLAFQNLFVANFLSSWVANKYETACLTGNHDTLKKPPVEDGLYLAECAWKELQNHKL